MFQQDNYYCVLERGEKLDPSGVWWPISLTRNYQSESYSEFETEFETDFEIEFEIEFESEFEVELDIEIEF